MLKHLRNREGWGEKNLPQKGFTLVELLVVIVILGILAAVVVFAVSGSTTKAQSSACQAELSSVQTAVEAFNASTGAYPTAMSDLTTGSNKFLRSTPTLYDLSGTSGGLTRTAAGVSQGCAVPT